MSNRGRSRSRADTSSAHDSYYDGEIQVVSESYSDSLQGSPVPSESTANSSYRTPSARRSISYFDGEVQLVEDSPPRQPEHDPTEALERLSVEKRRMTASASTPEPGSAAKTPLSSKEKEVSGKLLKLFSGALATHWDDEEECGLMANIVQEAMLEKYGKPDAAYRKKARELMFNIRDQNNGSLVDQIMTGSVSPDQLLTMSSDELANDNIRAQNEDVRRKQIRNATPIKAPTHTMDFECPQCSKGPAVIRHVNAYEEPVASYMKCTNCSYEYKL